MLNLGNQSKEFNLSNISANLFSGIFLLKQEKVLSREKLVTSCEEFFSQRYNALFSFLFLLKQDPIAARSDLRRLLIEAKILIDWYQQINFI